MPSMYAYRITLGSRNSVMKLVVAPNVDDALTACQQQFYLDDLTDCSVTSLGRVDLVVNSDAG